MRLFVAVRPPEHVLDQLAELAHPDAPGVRWTTRDQWHVTLRFLGNVDDPEPVITAVRDAVHSLSAVEVALGPRAGMLGRGVVQLPVSGLDEVARAVIAATADVGDPPDRRGFKGHLTLARTNGHRLDLSSLHVAASWPVDQVELIRSRLGRGPATYETLAVVPLQR